VYICDIINSVKFCVLHGGNILKKVFSSSYLTFII